MAKGKVISSRTLDVEPRWMDLAPWFMQTLENPDAPLEVKEIARDHIKQMAQGADCLRQGQKCKLNGADYDYDTCRCTDKRFSVELQDHKGV